MATASSQSYYNEVQSIFIELFDRPAATAGYNYFGSELATGANPVTVFGQIAGSPEVSSSLTVTDLFENLLGRTPAAAGLAFFNGEIAGGMTIAQVASQIYTDVLAEPTNSQDYLVMTDKIAYANNYTGYLGANPSFTYNTANASAYINQVNPTTVMTGTVATGSNMPAVNAFVAGTTVDLMASSSSYIEPSTAGIVDFVLDSGVTGAQTSNTQLAGDTLQAGAGGATLTINGSITVGTTTASYLPTMSGVSTILVNTDAASDVINISGLSGVTSLVVDGVAAGSGNNSTIGYTESSTQNVTLESIANAAPVTMYVNSTGTSGNVTLENVGLLTTPADILTLDVNANPKASSMATLNLTLEGNNSVTIADTATSTLTSLNLTDTTAKDDTMITGTNYIDSVNASNDDATLTYVMTTTQSNSSKAFTFTGGTGTDTVVLTAVPNTGVTYAFDGNSAGTNTLEFNYAAPTAGDIKSYTNDASHFTGLGFYTSVTTMPTIDMANMNSSINNVTFSSGAATIVVKDALGTGTSGTSGDVFNINQNVGTSFTISDASGNNAANLTMGGGFTVAAIDTYLSPLAGVAPQSYINIESNSSSANTVNTITALNVADGATVTLTGSEALTITAVDATTSPTPSAGLTVNAGALTGALTLTLSNGAAASLNDTVTVGNANGNSITLNASNSGHDTVTVGTGTNTINAEATAYTYSTTAPTSSATLTGYTAITDNNYTVTTGTHVGLTNLTIITPTATTGGVISSPTMSEISTTTANISSSATQAQAIHDVAAYMTAHDTTVATNYANWFQYGGDTYIVSYSVGTATTDYAYSVVQLVGTASTLATDLTSHQPTVTVG